MKFLNIKNRALRRVAIVAALPLVVVQYAYLGIKSMVAEMPFCWNYQYPAE